MKGQVLFQMQRFEEAIPLLQPGIQSDTETLMLGEALRHVKRYRDSIEVLKTLPVDEGLSVQALVIRAANYMELDEPENAIEILKTAAQEAQPRRCLEAGPLHSCQGVRTGKKADAVRHLRRVFAADPGFMDVESGCAVWKRHRILRMLYRF